jgi:hypothetical protein
VALKLLSKSPSGDELARFIQQTLQTENKILGNNIHAVMRDGAAVNGAALKRLELSFSFCVFLICLSHSMNNIGSEIKKSCMAARSFIGCWAICTAHSNCARMKFKELTGVTVKRISKVRWFTFWEVGTQFYDYYASVVAVVNDGDDFAEESRESCRAYIGNDDSEKKLRLESAMIKDCEFMATFKPNYIRSLARSVE